MAISVGRVFHYQSGDVHCVEIDVDGVKFMIHPISKTNLKVHDDLDGRWDGAGIALLVKRGLIEHKDGGPHNGDRWKWVGPHIPELYQAKDA